MASDAPSIKLTRKMEKALSSTGEKPPQPPDGCHSAMQLLNYLKEIIEILKLLKTTIPDISFGISGVLPATYKVKRCWYCKNWSTTSCPWPLVDTNLAAWHPLLPWNRGSKDKPSGDLCKPCYIALRLLSRKLFEI